MDDESFEEFAITAASRLARSAVLLCRDVHTAEDLVQEALTKTYVAFQRRQIRADPLAFAQKVMLNTFLSQRRRRSASEVVIDTSVSVQTDVERDWAEAITVQGALDNLDPLDRAVLVLRYAEDLGAPEVAHLLSMTPGAVRVRAHRATQRLRAELESTFIATRTVGGESN